MGRFWKFHILSLLFYCEIARSAIFYYVVKDGDTLSDILYSQKIKPLYGKHGTLNKILALNPHLKKHQGNQIFQGTRLVLDSSLVLKEEVPLGCVQQSPPKMVEVAPPSNRQPRELSHSDFTFWGLGEFLRMNAIDKTTHGEAVLLSDASFGFDIVWAQHWNQKISSYLDIQSQNVTIQEAHSSQVVLQGKAQQLSGFGVGLGYGLSSRLDFHMSLHVRETLVSRPLDDQFVQIEKFLSTQSIVGVSYTLIEKEKLKMKGLVDIVFLLPSSQNSYVSELSYGDRLGLRIEDQVHTFKLLGEVFYKNENNIMATTDFKQVNLGILIGFQKEYGVVP